MGVWYCTREDVKSALDSKETARNNAQVDRQIEAASRSAEGLLHRKFYPQEATRYFDWPPRDRYGRSGRLWLDADELISVSSLTSGGRTIVAADHFLEPANSGPPFTHIDIDLSSNAVFGGGDTHQRSIVVTGVFGYSADEAPAGALAEALDASETAVDVADSALIGVGQILRCDTERMIVTGRSMLDTGQTLQTPLAASVAEVGVAVNAGNAYSVGEVILLDAERMLIVDIAGTNLIVKRAWDGSVLAAHTGSIIYAARTLTVERGALGTTAAAHTTATSLTKHVVPALVRQLVIGETLNALQQEGSGYARVIGSGDTTREASGRGLRDLREQAYTRHGRKVRARAV